LYFRYHIFDYNRILQIREVPVEYGCGIIVDYMEKAKKQKVIRVIFIIAGALLMLDTILVKTTSGWNLGVVLPALLGIPLLAYGLFKSRLDIWFEKGTGKFIKWFFIAGYLFLAVIFIVSGIMMAQAVGKKPAPGADALIVLGAGIRGETVSYTLQNRLDAAIGYFNENPNTVIVVSGGYGNGEQFSEAHAMKKYLVRAGISEDKIIEEDRSRSTAENFRNSKEILDGIFDTDYNVVFVTNDYHVLRSGIIAEQAGLRAEGLSAPTPGFIVPNSYAREALALIAQCVFGSS